MQNVHCKHVSIIKIAGFCITIVVLFDSDLDGLLGDLLFGPLGDDLLGGLLDLLFGDLLGLTSDALLGSHVGIVVVVTRTGDGGY